jgi:putative membrane protein
MMRLIASAVIAIIANAIGLVVASLLLEDMSLGAIGFIIAVLIFTGVAVLIEPLMRQIALKNAPAILGSSSLIAVLISLIVTAVVSSSLSISGLLTWVLATVIVWAAALAGRLFLPMVIFKKVLAEANARRR